ncbi:MAG TPA: 8-oxoguanine deaminase [Candidatus Didemnitutus sp.]|nr:8-oxoguanine deaminase [Candidatus Didemnitutus sp.]
MSGELLVRNCGAIATMDPAHKVLRDGWIHCRSGRIVQVGSGVVPSIEGAQVVDARGGVALPGLINTHHHMYQNLARAYSPIANVPLLPWLAGLTPLWRHFKSEDLGVATQVALAELMLTGCTTTTDHHYVFPPDCGDLVGAQFAAAAEMGIRFHASRGSMDKASDLIPEWAVQPVDVILRDSERLISRHHDAAADSMNRVVLAPCAMTSVSTELFRECANLARHHGLQLHTHCGETIAENDLAVKLTGMRPLEWLETVGWAGENVWLAHGIHFDDAGIAHLGRHRMGVAHCPCSNMRLGSGVCRVYDLQRAGARVGLGVDGSASNDSGHMLNEARQALLLARVTRGAGAMTPMEALHLATMGGAEILGRSADLGSLEAGKCADIAIFPATDLFSSGAENIVDALVLCFPRPVDTLIVNGRVRVSEQGIRGLDLAALLGRHAKIARRIVG